MKKTRSALIALVAFAFCMNACTNAQAKQNRSDDDIKEEVARRVKEIYDIVIPWYNSHEGDIRSVNDFDERFLSKDMQMMRAQVGAILRELHEKGEDDIPPGYDYDHWVMGQDWENLSIRTDSIRVLSPDTAEAYMCITNCGYPQKFMLMMTRDEKEWFIDDFRQYDEQAKGFAISDKRNIQDYINENPPSAATAEWDSEIRKRVNKIFAKVIGICQEAKKRGERPDLSVLCTEEFFSDVYMDAYQRFDRFQKNSDHELEASPAMWGLSIENDGWREAQIIRVNLLDLPVEQADVTVFCTGETWYGDAPSAGKVFYKSLRLRLSHEVQRLGNKEVDGWYIADFLTTDKPDSEVEEMLKCIYSEEGEGGEADSIVYYYWDYPETIHNHMDDQIIELAYVGDSVVNGYFWGNSDEFDVGREGYYPGYFVLNMKEIRQTGNRLSFLLDARNIQYLDDPVEIGYHDVELALKHGARRWNQENGYGRDTARYNATVSGNHLILHKEKSKYPYLEDHIFVKMKQGEVAKINRRFTKTAIEELLMCCEPTPQFPGGDEACQEFIRRNIRYSDEMIKKGIKGRVVVGFKVEKDGSLSNLRIKKSSDARLNDEALRVVRSMPKWEPAQKDGEAIETDFNLPVMFQLNSPVFYIADSVYLYPDERAMFPGGDAACQEWLRDRVRYPADCQREKLEGRVLVTFVVRYNGVITDAKVVQKVDSRLEEEALYAIRNMPKWIPARMKGKAVSSRYTIPVRFTLKEMRNH